MPKIKKIDHVALVVGDINEALNFWQVSLGLKLDHIADIPKEQSAIAFLPVGGSEIELVQPTSDDSGVAKYLQKRGPGMHHICLEVDDLKGMLAQLKAREVQLIHEEPVIAESGKKYAFIHPKTTFGVLVELYELPDSERVFPVLETERLLLREFDLTDAPAVFEIFSREDLSQWLEHEPMQTIEEAEQRVGNRIRLFERGLGYRWAITLKEAPETVIGSCGYFHVRLDTQTFETGYEIHPQHWRKGLMTEALTAMLNYSFNDAPLKSVHRLEALVDPQNRASIRLLEKLGFQAECLRREFGFWKGQFQDVILFALLRNDWDGS